MTGERKLWIEVLLRGLAESHAQEWRASQDFVTCCDLAGFPHAIMRTIEPERAKRVLKRVWPHIDTAGGNDAEQTMAA